MTPQQPEFIKLTDDIAEIKYALLGNALSGRKGIIHYHDLLVEDMYAIGSDGQPIEGKKNTIPLRVSAIEDRQKRALWIFSGIAIAFVAAREGISALIDKLWSK